MVRHTSSEKIRIEVSRTLGRDVTLGKISNSGTCIRASTLRSEGRGKNGPKNITRESG